MRAIVTGASGFIGRYIVEELDSAGYDVIAVVRTLESKEKVLFQFPELKNTSFVLCKDMNFDVLANSIDEADYFFHLAWSGVSGHNANNIECQFNNIKGSLCALNIAKLLGCKRFIGAGSIHEIECIHEMEVDPLGYLKCTNYKAAKLFTHYVCEIKANELGIDFLWPRITNAFGPGEKSHRLINTLIRQLLRGEVPKLTKGDQLYNFIYVSECARAFRMVAEKGQPFHQYIIGTSDVRPLHDYIIEMRDAVSPETMLGFGEIELEGTYLSESDFSNASLCSDTDFEERIDFRQGILLLNNYLKESEFC